MLTINDLRKLLFWLTVPNYADTSAHKFTVKKWREKLGKIVEDNLAHWTQIYSKIKNEKTMTHAWVIVFFHFTLVYLEAVFQLRLELEEMSVYLFF